MSLVSSILNLVRAVDRLADTIAPRRSISVEWSVGPATSDTEAHMLNLELLDNQKVHVSARPTDAGGVPVPEQFLNGLTWETSDPNVASVTVDPDGFGAYIGTPTVGAATVTVSGTATDGTALTDTISVLVKPTAPSNLNLTAGAPELE